MAAPAGPAAGWRPSRWGRAMGHLRPAALGSLSSQPRPSARDSGGRGPRPLCVRSDRSDRNPAAPDGAAPSSKRRRGHRRERTNSRMANLTFPSAPDPDRSDLGGLLLPERSQRLSEERVPLCHTCACQRCHAVLGRRGHGRGSCWVEGTRERQLLGGGDTGEAAAGWRG
uniref:Uncharacterized protein n=1 Tax=Pipistrellus kuhlii TaxID=59472 RepID=A0A7J7RN04_PIPKU|nr:hypothetical protein mPipKuh1_010394 [Pipistrellus kuhlii]